MKTKPMKPHGRALARRMAIAGALAAACAALAAVKAFAADEVALWHCKITVNSVGSGEAVTPDVPNIASGSASAMESLNPLILEFDVNQNVEPIRDTLQATYTWESRSQMRLEGALMCDSEGHGQGSSLADWEVALTRHFNPIECDSFFFVDDEWERDFAPDFPPKTYSTPRFDDSLPPSHYEMIMARSVHLSQRSEEGDKLDFHIRAEFPVTVISNDYVNGDTSTESSISSFEDWGVVNYDYRMAAQTLRPEPVTGVYGTGVVLPKVDVSRYNIELNIARKPAELTLSASPGKGKGSAIRFRNKITVGGVECSRLFKVHRLERDWFLMEDPQDPGTYQSWEVVNEWHDVTDDGNMAAERDVSFDSFFPPKSPRGAWGDRVYIAEFLDAVERLPELGFLYHVVTLMTSESGKPATIDAFEAKKVDASTWCELFSREGFLPANVPLVNKLATKKLP